MLLLFPFCVAFLLILAYEYSEQPAISFSNAVYTSVFSHLAKKVIPGHLETHFASMSLSMAACVSKLLHTMETATKMLLVTA